MGQEKNEKRKLRIFDDIEATKVVIRNTKLYVNEKKDL